MLKKLFKKPDQYFDQFTAELNKPAFDKQVLLEQINSENFSIDHQDKNGNTLLHLCIENNQFKSALWLIEEGASIDKVLNKQNLSPLSLLIEKNNTALLKTLLEKNLIDLNQKDEANRTLLHNAAFMGSSDVAKLFIQHGCDINAVDNNNRNVIFDALSFGDKKFIKHLLSLEGLRLDLVDNNGDTIMHHSQVLSDEENAIMLIRAGADLTVQNKKQETFLSNVALKGIEAERVIKESINSGVDINVPVRGEDNLLQLMIDVASKLPLSEQEKRKSLIKVLKIFIGAGLNLNVTDENNETVLFNAVRQKDLEQVDYLLSSGINPNIINKDGENVLHMAIYDGLDSLDVILSLLKYDADPTIKNSKEQVLYEVLNKLVLHTHNKKAIEDQKTVERINPEGHYLPLFEKIMEENKASLNLYDSKDDPLFFEPLMEDHFPLFKLYLQNGFNVHKKDKEGNNLLFKYVLKVFKDGDLSVDFQNNLNALLSKKVEHNAQNEDGHTVLHKVMHTDCGIALFDILTRSTTFDFKAQDKMGRTVVHEGVWNDQQMVIKRIHNLDFEVINIPDNYGILPITYAALLGNQKLVLFFLDLRSNIKSNVSVSEQAVKKFRSMLKNLSKLEDGLEDKDRIAHVQKVIDQILLDFSDKKQKVFA